MKYTVQPTTGSHCPGCNALVALLSPASWEDTNPAFYLCTCGFIGQVSSHVVRPPGAGAGLTKSQAEHLLRYITSLCDELSTAKGNPVPRTAYAPGLKDGAMAFLRRVSGEDA